MHAYNEYKHVYIYKRVAWSWWPSYLLEIWMRRICHRSSGVRVFEREFMCVCVPESLQGHSRKERAHTHKHTHTHTHTHALSLKTRWLYMCITQRWPQMSTSKSSVLQPLSQEIILKRFGSPDPSLFLIDLWVTGSPLTHLKTRLKFWDSRENLFDMYGDSCENL